MSFNPASKAKSIDKQFSSLSLIGGRDTNPNALFKGVDLRVEGGALVKKTMCVLGNIYVGQFLMADTVGNVYTDLIQEKHLTEGIKIVGDLIPDDTSTYNLGSPTNFWSNLYVDNGCIPTIETDSISPKTGNSVTINDNLQIDSLQGAPFDTDLFTGVAIGDVLQWDGTKYTFGAGGGGGGGNIWSNDFIPSINNNFDLGSSSKFWKTLYAQTVCSPTVQTDTIDPKTGSTVQLNGTINVTSGVQTSTFQNAPFDSDLLTGVSVGDVLQWDGTKYTFVTGGGGGWTPVATSNLNMNCFSVNNVLIAHVKHLYGTSACIDASTDINVENTLYVKNTPSGGKIKYEGGIAIGDDNTTVSSTNNIAIGKFSIASGTDSVGVGFYSEAKGLSSVAIGSACYTGGQRSIAIGSSATTALAVNAIAHGFISQATSTNAVAIGTYAQATNTQSIAIGYKAYATQPNAIAIGSLNCTASANFATAIGPSAVVSAEDGSAFGHGAICETPQGLALGSNAQTNGTNWSLALNVHPDSIVTDVSPHTDMIYTMINGQKCGILIRKF